jgi:hypothetical protein
VYVAGQEICLVGETYTERSHTGIVYDSDQRCLVEGGGGEECEFCEYPTSDPEDCSVGSEEERTVLYDEECGCCYISLTPILINVSGSAKLTDALHGVRFDIFATHSPVLTPWPAAEDDGWLAMDRNGNGTIDSGSELFGNRTRLPSGEQASNGFLALAILDSNGDGLIDARDPQFADLRVWRDRSRDGISQPDELLPLESLGIRAISVDYRLSRKVDEWGNAFRYRAPVYFVNGAVKFAWDVVFVGIIH